MRARMRTPIRPLITYSLGLQSQQPVRCRILIFWDSEVGSCFYLAELSEINCKAAGTVKHRVWVSWWGDRCRAPSHEDTLLSYIPESLMFYLSHVDLQSTWNWYFMLSKRKFTVTMDYKIKPARIPKTSSFFSRFFLIHGTLSWPWPYKITEVTLPSIFLPSCCPSQVLFLTLQASPVWTDTSS